MKEKALSVMGMIRHGLGKARRFAYNHLRHNYVDTRLALRRGDCARCGACCKLLFKCPFLADLPDGNTYCRIHAGRPGNCRLFPLDKADLKDRDLLRPDQPCGYWFPDDERRAPPARQVE